MEQRNDVVVVGAGVIGLSIAHELATAGHAVRVVAAREATASVSGVAAAIWFPHAVDHSAEVLDSAAVTYRRLEQLAGDPRTGVHMRPGTVLSRRPDPDTSWRQAVPRTGPADPATLPPGATGVPVGTPATAVFNEPVQPATIDFVLRNPANAVVPSATTYDSGTRTATLTPDGDVVVLAGPVRTR